MEKRLLAILGGTLANQLVDLLKNKKTIEIDSVSSLGDALQKLSENPYQYILLDYEPFENEAIPFLRRLNRQSPLTDLFVLANVDSITDVTIDKYFDKKSSLKEIVTSLEDAIAIREILETGGMIGHSQNLKDAARRVQQVAPTDISVLITGPSGSGKELIARSLHNNSPRKNFEFVSINCASIPEGLLESELFGHEKGSFTGADVRQEGLIQVANKGTLFLDEIGEMHPRLQAKLLRAIETKAITPVGGRKATTVDVRFVAATNRELQTEVDYGNFRADLYYRLGVISIKLMRLAERQEDILPIVAFFLGRVNKNVSFSSEATELLLKYGWPGNVRELINFLQRLLVTNPKGEISREIVLSLLDRHIMDDRALPVVTKSSPEESGYRLIYQALVNLANEVMDMKRILTEGNQRKPLHNDAIVDGLNGNGDMEAMEEKLIKETLTRVNGNRKKAADILGIGERTLYRKLKRYHIM